MGIGSPRFPRDAFLHQKGHGKFQIKCMKVPKPQVQYQIRIHDPPVGNHGFFIHTYNLEIYFDKKSYRNFEKSSFTHFLLSQQMNFVPLLELHFSHFSYIYENVSLSEI